MQLLQRQELSHPLDHSSQLLHALLTHPPSSWLVEHPAHLIQLDESFVDQLNRPFELEGLLLRDRLHLHWALLRHFLLFNACFWLHPALAAFFGERLVLAAFVHILIYSYAYFIFNWTERRIIVLNKMINGMSISQISQINLRQLSHYQRLDHIVNCPPSNFSVMSRSLSKAIHNNKTIHQNWRKHQKSRQEAQIERSNELYSRKLHAIMAANSRYHFKDKHSPSVSRSHHFYTRLKREQEIDLQNPEIARRIIATKGNLNLTKASIDFQRSQIIAHRLEKFPIVRRLHELSEKRFIRQRRYLTEDGQPRKPLQKRQEQIVNQE